MNSDLPAIRNCAVRLTWTNDILVATLAGELRDADSASVVSHFLRALAERRPGKLLLDLRELRAHLSMAELFFAYRSLAVGEANEGLQCARKLRIALLDREALRDHSAFHETTARNSGFHVTCFFNEADAVRWLTHQAPPKSRPARRPETFSVPDADQRINPR